jgi:outer membrane protein
LAVQREVSVNTFLLATLVVILFECNTASQAVPIAPNVIWQSADQKFVEDEAQQILSRKFIVNSGKVYSLAELIDLAQRNNPETRLAWERARSRAEAVGVARSELYPILVAAALSDTTREQEYVNTRFFRQTIQTFALGVELNYTIFDFGARTGRIDAAQAELLAADFGFNDTHRILIFQVQAAYYQLLNAGGQEAAARANLANAETVRESAEARLQNGLATLPDVLEARSAAAQAAYDLQAAVGAREIAHGNLLQALGASPLSSIRVQSIDELTIPESTEVTIDQAIDHALLQRPDLMQQFAAIRAANARVREARSAYYPSLQTNVRATPEALFGMQQQLPWGYTADLDGRVALTLRWTVFDAGREHRLAGAIDDIRASQSQAATTRDRIENEIWTAYSNLKTAFRQREAAAALLQSAQQSYNAALESYRYGVRNLIDVTQAQRTLAQARSTDVQARTQVLTAVAGLAFRTADSIQSPGGRRRP